MKINKWQYVMYSDIATTLNYSKCKTILLRRNRSPFHLRDKSFYPAIRVFYSIFLQFSSGIIFDFSFSKNLPKSFIFSSSTEINIVSLRSAYTLKKH